MVTIFSDIISKRLKYVLGIIFEDREIQYEVVNDTTIFETREGGLKLVYSDYPFDFEYPTLSPCDLLLEEQIKEHHIQAKKWQGEEVIAIDGKVDPFASIFYLITCYDEYLSDEFDEHDRYPGAHSLLFKFGWNEKLMVERWCEKIINFIEKENNATITRKVIPFNLIPSFDIDNTYAYRLKYGIRKWMSVSKDLLRFDKKRLFERRQVVKGELKDPYDTFDYIKSIISRGFDVKMFWLLGDFATYDRNVDYENPDHQSLIRSFAQLTNVGLHPSYQSNNARSILQKEKSRIEQIVGEEIDSARNHFLKLKIPYTYEQQLKCGFLNDYTLGFADIPGFRAGIARPFQWYNLQKDQCTELSLHPFTVMDGTLKEYMHLSPHEANQKLDALKSEVKKYGGNFIMIWHNETIGDYGKWKGWKDVLEHFLEH
jgi:hypothetical protein